jgi:hypothetical protein
LLKKLKSASRGASAAYMRVVDNSYLGTSDEVCLNFESSILILKLRNLTDRLFKEYYGSFAKWIENTLSS